MTPPTHEKNHALEAARYALMRRLVPSLLHNMAGALQPISMTAAIMEKRLQSPTPDLILLGKSSTSFKAQSRDVADTFAHLATWLAPQSDQSIAVNAGVEEIIGMMARELSDRGFEIVNETKITTAELPQTILRSVFMASLVALTDTAESPGRIIVTSIVTSVDIIGDAESGESVEISLTISLKGHPEMDKSIPVDVQRYRKLDWDDVKSLAKDEKVGIECTTHGVTLHIKNSGRVANEIKNVEVS